MDEPHRLDEEHGRGRLCVERVGVRKGRHYQVPDAVPLKKSPNLGQDILAMLIDEFGFTSRATIDGRCRRRGNGNCLSPHKPKQEQVKGTSLLSSSPGEEMV
ncbi:hypothetical protein AUP68_13970 [Ilyonectria robusta]